MNFVNRIIIEFQLHLLQSAHVHESGSNDKPKIKANIAVTIHEHFFAVLFILMSAMEVCWPVGLKCSVVFDCRMDIIPYMGPAKNRPLSTLSRQSLHKSPSRLRMMLMLRISIDFFRHLTCDDVSTFRSRLKTLICYFQIHWRVTLKVSHSMYQEK